MINSLLSTEGASIITVYFLQLIVLLAFLKFLFFQSDDKPNLIKIIGGLTVFIIAILSKAPQVYFLSLLIGGLIIASEDFLKFIFALWRSSPEKIDKTIQSFTKATVSEIETKKEAEIKSLLLEGKADEEEVAETKKRYVSAEREVNKFFREKYGSYYKEEIKVENKSGVKIFDGAVISKTTPADIFDKEEMDGRNDLGIQKVIEIKFLKNPSSAKKTVRRMLEKFGYYRFITNYEIAIVFEALSKKEAEKIYSEIVNEYREMETLKLYIFSLKDEQVELLKS